MQKIVLYFGIAISLISCKNDAKSTAGSKTLPSTTVEVYYANGFEAEAMDGYQVLKIKEAWPGADKVFNYAIGPSEVLDTLSGEFDAKVATPIKKIVVTSTTHIPSLEALGVGNSLAGFPNTEYISSEAARKRIDAGQVTELGQNESLNTELLIDLQPDALITFAVSGDNATARTVSQTGIPVLYNSDWTETHPLGKAEWIKFFGLLYGKEAEADSIFEQIEQDYLAAKELAKTASFRPTVMSGAMYKDVWYLPQGESWAAQFLNDAGSDYLWKETEGTGSISLNLESVLETAVEADYWIGPGQFTSYTAMQEAHPVYGQFKPLKDKMVFSFTNKKGATGGVIYFELAPNRPDLVLKDLIHILHPELLPDYQLQFFSPLDP